MNYKLLNLILGAVIALLLVGEINSCKHSEDKDAKIEQLQLNNQRTDSIKNKLGQKVLEQEVIITTSKTALKSMTDSLFNLKRSDERKIKSVIAYYKSIIKTGVDSVPVPYVDTVAKKQFEDSVAKQCAQVIDYYERNYISVPRTAEDSTVDYNVKVDILRDQAKITFHLTPDTQQIRFVVLKGGLLKKDVHGKRHFILRKKVVAQVLHTNKQFEVVGQNSAIYEPKGPPKLLIGGVLIGLGVILGSQL